jgi:ubiquinone/menaquinone biosynthesis C-methylase UbiE
VPETFWDRGALAIAKFLRVDMTHSQKHYARTLSSLVADGDRWLDIGCGRQIFPEWAMSPARQRALAERVLMLVGMDVDSSILEHPLVHQRVVGRGEDLPFDAATFDLISANMVFEHVEHPEQVLREVRRVLKPGGRLVFHTPNYHNYLVALASVVPDFIKHRLVWLLEGRREADIFPTLYRLNTIRSIRQAAERSGLEPESISTHVSAGEFYTLGPVGWVECIWLKLISAISRGRCDAALIVVLRRPSRSARVEAGDATMEQIAV